VNYSKGKKRKKQEIISFWFVQKIKKDTSLYDIINREGEII